MKDAQKTIIGLFLAAVVLGGFWMYGISPKRDEAKKLDRQVSKLQGELTSRQAEVAAGQAAKKTFPADYQQVLLLGKAVPAGDDTGSLLVQLQSTSESDATDFRSLELSKDAAGAAVAAAAPVAATESAVAVLPIGATVGSAGLGVLPYTLKFTGDYFDVADLLGGIDNLVTTEDGRVVVDGRLLTIDGFSLKPPENGGSGLEATFAVSSYTTPPGQGITAGASAAAPATTTALVGTTPAAATTTTTTTTAP